MVRKVYSVNRKLQQICSKYLLLKDWFKSWVEFFSNVFKKTWLAKSNRILEAAKKVFVGEFYDINAVVFFLNH